jgi:hypothetical protein
LPVIKALKLPTAELEKPHLAQDEWKLRYFNDMETRDKEILELKEKLEEAEENTKFFPWRPRKCIGKKSNGNRIGEPAKISSGIDRKRKIK